MTNQHLISPTDKMTVVQDLCGLQAQFMANALHALKIRTVSYDAASIDEDLVKNWTLRGTVHIFAESDLSLFIHCNNGSDYRRNDWNGYTFWNQRDKWALTPDRQKFFSEVILHSLAGGSLTREELKQICRENGMTEPEEGSMFDQWGGGIRELCERGFMNYVVQEKKAYCLSPTFTPIPEEEAKLEIARRYFTNFAPATIHDAMYFLGTTQTQIKKWLSLLPVKSVEVGSKTYYYIENGKMCDRDIPPCVFLAGFDQLMLGYQKKESIYLPPEHLRRIFNLAGIVMPALLLHGQVAGRWKKKNRKLSIEPFVVLNQEDIATVKEAAEILWDDIASIEFTG